ncbi:MAG TPA: mechanosensitive ion channel domain-containing protein [Pseudonocardiaceae bacterium]|jgi:small conductance mechanosensitive channel
MSATVLLQRPACADEAGTWCQRVYDLTNNDWISRSADWVIAKPVAIIVILTVAMLIRALVHRAINRLTTGSADGKVPALLRPLAERAPESLVGPLVSERRAQRAKTIGSVLRSVTSFVVLGIALVLILGVLGLNLAPIIASAGIVGIALGFGAQNLVKDFLSGIFMMLEDQYGVGDTVDLGPANGVVEAVGLRVTTLRDGTGTVWYVRNGEVLRVGNKSQGYSVAVVDLPLPHSADLTQAIELASSVAAEVTSAEPVAEHILEPPEVLGVEAVTPDTVTLRLTVKVHSGQQFMVQRALLAAIKTAFDNAGITEPYQAGRPTAPASPSGSA